MYDADLPVSEVSSILDTFDTCSCGYEAMGIEKGNFDCISALIMHFLSLTENKYVMTDWSFAFIQNSRMLRVKYKICMRRGCSTNFNLFSKEKKLFVNRTSKKQSWVVIATFIHKIQTYTCLSTDASYQ